MRLGVLGPVRCAVEGSPVEVRGRLNLALLAALAVDRDRVTGIDELVDALWGDRPPTAAEKVVRNRVSLLRGTLTSAFIDTVGAGYQLGAGVAVDVSQFDDRSIAGRERLRLWRGPPYEEIAEWPPAQAAAVRLGEMYAHLQEVAIAEQLDAGADASALVATAEGLVDAAPFRERRWALLMRTLYLAGRQHDALRAFQRARALLRDELGLSPGAELLAIERAILNQEPSLDPPASAPRPGVVPGRRLTSALVGRAEDAVTVQDLLSESRLVTPAGLGGVGKTSLATHVSGRWSDRCLVDLRTVDHPAGVNMKAFALARTARSLTEMGRPDRAAIFAGAAHASYWTSGDTGTRAHQIDPDDHAQPAAMYDLRTSMEVGELVALLDRWLADLDAGGKELTTT
jgi:DNA-binding SARP family transcriptional activator